MTSILPAIRAGAFCIMLLAISEVSQAAPAQSSDISGTWIAKVTTPVGAMDFVYRLKVTDGQLTGSQATPAGESSIVDGQIQGDQFKFTVLFNSFGAPQKIGGSGRVVGDTLLIVPAVPPLPPAAVGAEAPALQPLVFRRGFAPANTEVDAFDYKSLPAVKLPDLKPVAYNGLAKTPPMGWNSWNKFGVRISDQIVREMADAMVAAGMKDAGYTYINIDDGWQGHRDPEGRLQANANFPDMKALADYVHAKGLKLGIYSSPGPRSCAGFDASYGHEEIDAKTWAAWGIDYLKYDWCSARRVWKDSGDMRAVYQRMGEALRKSGRPIVFSLCQYGLAGVQGWGRLVGGNLWRTSDDIQDRWQRMAAIGFSQSPLAPFAGRGHWNDPDMLEVGNGKMTADEYRTHFSLWALLAAPLIAGNDLRDMSAETREILMNREVIDVDQDSLGKQGTQVFKEGDTEVWSRPLRRSARAVALFNRGAAPADMSVKWAALGVKSPRHVRDLWTHLDLVADAEGYSASVPSHGVVLLRVAP
jgi:alpha-galactosidase